jgi:vancomycin resistance protein VanJ
MRRFVEFLLLLYLLFLSFYLVLRFLIQADWNWLLLLHNAALYFFLLLIPGILLALLIRTRRIAGFYLLFLVIGMLWFLPILAAKGGAGSAENSIHLISFNFFPENQQQDGAVEWLLAQDADMLLLQEIPAALPELEAAYPYFVYNTNSRHASFSRYPINTSGEFNLQEEAQQRLILEIDGQHIAIYNLHLWMPLNDKEADFLLFRYDETRRNAQISDLLRFVEGETLPLLLAGDFNMSEWSPIYTQLDSIMDDAYRSSSWGIGATWPAGASEELPNFLPPLFRLDYFWYSGGIEPLSVYLGQPLGSDHLPIIMDFLLEAE